MHKVLPLLILTALLGVVTYAVTSNKLNFNPQERAAGIVTRYTVFFTPSPVPKCAQSGKSCGGKTSCCPGLYCGGDSHTCVNSQGGGKEFFNCSGTHVEKCQNVNGQIINCRITEDCPRSCSSNGKGFVACL